MNDLLPRYKAVIFDIDFTLLDTEAFIFEAFYFTLKKTNLPQITPEVLKKLMGTSLEEIYKKLAPDRETATLAKIHRDFQAENIHLVTSFPNTEETLIKIKQAKIKIAAVTTRSKLNSQKTLEATNLMQYIDVLVSKEDVPADKLKPHPQPILKALEKLKVQAEYALSIGDTAEDIIAGRRAMTKTVGVTYGSLGEKIAQSKPDYVIDDIVEVPPIVGLSL